MSKKHLYICGALLLTALLAIPAFYTLGQTGGLTIRPKGGDETGA